MNQETNHPANTNSHGETGRTITYIARVHSNFPTKFGIPRQSGLAPDLKSTIIFEPSCRIAEAIRGLEEFSHLWLIWEFSEAIRKDWSPTVRPPRLGGNKRMGVFATRSPFRPNPIGLSCVRLDSIEYDTPQGAVLHVSGADLMDGTPIYDIKPYLPFTDAHPEAIGGFADQHLTDLLEVRIPEPCQKQLPPGYLKPLQQILSQDPRPAYQKDPERVYGFPYGNMEIKFRVDGDLLEVVAVIPLKPQN